MEREEEKRRADVHPDISPSRAGRAAYGSSSEGGLQTRARVVVGLFAMATRTISLLDVQGEGGETDKVTCR
jgi:hypothetical protein